MPNVNADLDADANADPDPDLNPDPDPNPDPDSNPDSTAHHLRGRLFQVHRHFERLRRRGRVHVLG